MIDDRLIETVEGGKHVRIRWSMYLDADPEKALQLAVRELWVNSCDELTYRGTKNGKVEIEIMPDERWIIVRDNGGGIPFEKMHDAFLTVNTGSNFHNRQGNLAGAMGIGLKAVSHTAEAVVVDSYRDGKVGTLEIAWGEHMGLPVKPTHFRDRVAGERTNGIDVLFEPSKEIYGDAWIDEKKLFAEVDEAAKFYPNITFKIISPSGNKVIKYPDGLRLKDTEAFYESENLTISLSLQPGDIKPFGNRLFLKEGGAFYTHFKTQLTKSINETIDFKIKGSEIQSALSGYIAVYVTNPVFSNQQKSAIGNKEINPEISKAVKEIVEQLKNSKNWQKFIKNLEAEVKAEEAAERARQKIKKAREGITKASRKKILLADKLKDCILEGEDAVLALCEGNSAQGSLNLARDINTVATYPIKGKIINGLKASIDGFLENQEVKEICQILGCDIFEKYNPKKLKYGKVLIATDADQDGLSISTLLMTFFYVCMPDFLKEGRLYWMKAPLYINREKHSYIFTKEEWDTVKNKAGYKRAKGVGEMSPVEVKESLFGEYKRWVQLKPKNWEAFSKLIEDLMGKDIETRREFIFENVNFENIRFL